MAVTYTADQVAVIIETLTARNKNESIERLPCEEHVHNGQCLTKPRSHAENSSQSSTYDTNDDGAATDNLGTSTGTEQRQDPGENSTRNSERRIQDRESNSHETDLAPPPLKKRGPKPLTDTPVSKRTAQNRVAQRAHRERREHYVKSLEDKIVTIQSEAELLSQQNAELQAQLDSALAALSRDKTRPDSLATSESTAPFAATGAHQNFSSISSTSTTPVTDIDNRGIAISTNGQPVDEILQMSVSQFDTSNTAELMGNTDLRSPEIQAILDNPDIADVGGSGTDWERFWTAWDSQIPALDSDFANLCCQTEQFHI